ncbi:MAG TPA: hypothetical protein VNY84_03325 [Acidimicrobiales bacterium]|nr:hypothetical protein [Acidimicrobiales bacterium]
MIPDGWAPPPTKVDGRMIVAGELRSLEGRLHFDIDRRQARADVSAVIAVSSPGWPAWDLRQPLLPSAFAHVDLGGGPGAEMRVLDRPLEPGELHRLDLSYALDTPGVADPRPIAWGDGTVAFDVWCSDLAPGRYLEQWLPVGLCQDRFSLTLEIEITGAGEPHTVIANGQIEGEWRIRWPDHHTSLSSLLVIAPASSLVAAEAGPVQLTAEAVLALDPVEQAERAAAYIETYSTRLGAYRHGRHFVAHLWDSTRGMEYDGAASASVNALEHEVFHSWYGRGIKPATANDGWIDEAITSWATGDGTGRLWAVEFPLDQPPVVLAPPSPWSRHTPREAYTIGARLFADLAWRTSVDTVLDALAAYEGSFVSTAALQAHLAASLGIDVAPWWDRYVRGVTPRSAAS